MIGTSSGSIIGQQRPAFSLVDLLVVAAFLAVVGMMLAPDLAKAKLKTSVTTSEIRLW
jgi:Tfp pilus assembly protein FimT